MSTPRSLPHPLTGQLFFSPVPPGTGWPEDVASATTPIAHTAAEVNTLAGPNLSIDELGARISLCRACPRLVKWREDVAREKRHSFADQPYWGRPIPGWGDRNPRLLIVGLAPAANGANRTGRIFTGDRSGDWLFGSLYRVGLATQPTSEHAGDGQQLAGVRMIATLRCAPPDNNPRSWNETRVHHGYWPNGQRCCPRSGWSWPSAGSAGMRPFGPFVNSAAPRRHPNRVSPTALGLSCRSQAHSPRVSNR